MIDVLAIGAHPDDCELSMGGTLALLKSKKYRIGICDLSRGETGTYGSKATRTKELKKAGEMLSLDVRITFDIPDGNIRNSEKSRLKIIEVIRQYTPRIVFSFVRNTRHPDHHYTGEMVKECMFLSGLEKIKTEYPPHRPSAFVRFPELIIWEKPDFVVDISDFWDQKIAALKSYKSQFSVDGSDSDGEPPKTFLKSKEMWRLLESKARMAGVMIGVKYGEPFYMDQPLRVEDPFFVIPEEFR